MLEKHSNIDFSHPTESSFFAILKKKVISSEKFF